MAELVDALDSGSSRGNPLDVRVILAAILPGKGTMSPQKIAFIANGEMEHPGKILSKIKTYDQLIAVDGGVNHCFHLGLIPSHIIGDLDSANEEALKHFHATPQILYEKEKDKTDLEIALEQFYSPEVKSMTVFGGLGKRIDHSLFNINLLTRYPGKLFLEFNDEKLFVIDRSVEMISYPGQTLSLIPLNGPVTGITTQGLKWELSNGKLDKHFMGISNICLSDRFSITVLQGDLLCVTLNSEC